MKMKEAAIKLSTKSMIRSKKELDEVVKVLVQYGDMPDMQIAVNVDFLKTR